MKKFISFLFFIICSEIYSQEMNCQIVINSDLVDQTNQQIFKTLENSLNEFINFNVWTNKSILINEKISCSFIINLSSYNSSNFELIFQLLFFVLYYNVYNFTYRFMT